MSEENNQIEQKKLTPEEIKKAKAQSDYKYMGESMKKRCEYEFSLLPEETRNLINQFVKIAVENQMTDDEILDCLKFMPAEYAEQICDRLKYFCESYNENEQDASKRLPKHDKLITKLCKFYANEFVVACNKAKGGVPKIPTPADYKKNYKNKKGYRFLSYYELFMILCGMGIPLTPLIISSETPPDNKYYRVVKALHTERFPVKYRNSEYRMLCSLHENFVQDAIEIQASIISKHNETTI